MFTEETVKTVSECFSIIEAVENSLKAAYTIESSSRQGEKTLFFKTEGGDHLLGFGLWYDLWTQFQHPLWYGVHSTWPKSVFSCFTQKNSGQYIDFKDYRLCFVSPKPGETEAAAGEVAGILQEQLAALASG